MFGSPSNEKGQACCGLFIRTYIDTINIQLYQNMLASFSIQGSKPIMP